jgi:hypothetical protein
MKEKITFSIPTPCHENWDLMHPNEQGRFCMICTKTVVDFSSMNDEEILLFFTTQKEATCGRVRQDQLRVNYLPKHVKRFLVAFATIFLFVSVEGQAQTNTKNEGVYQRKSISKGHDSLEVGGERVSGLIVNHSNKVIRGEEFFNGIVLDEYNKPLDFVSVKLNKSNQTIGTFKTNAKGEFSFSHLSPGDYNVEFSFTGYTYKLIQITLPMKRSIRVQLKKNLRQKKVMIKQYHTTGLISR